MSSTKTEAAELLVRQEGGALTLTLNRPEVLNALTLPMMSGMLEQLKKAEKDRAIRCVVIAASGRAFCAGADLADLRKRQSEAAFSLGDELRLRFNPLIDQIRRMEKPVVGAVNGIAAGAGASLILSTDIKVCSEKASFVNAFVKVGLVPDSGMTYFLPRHLGLSLALEHAWTAKPITAELALRSGWVNRVVPASALESETGQIVSELCQAPPRAVALTKRALNRSLESGFEEQMDYEARLQEILGRTKDHQEGVSAFLEKRVPKFTGD
ncbi:MAG: enoyl-CoA hydratase/isomerase family protein [Elusimicrobia bacterium]|nr:enoyl-CoA hydratase/isomerase family protein [Elusimicrobiota bacterium]